MRKLRFKSRGPVDKDEMWEIIEENEHLTIEDFDIKGNNVDIRVYGPVDIDHPSVKDFIRYMKENGFMLGR